MEKKRRMRVNDSSKVDGSMRAEKIQAGAAAVTGAKALAMNKWKIQVAAGMVKKAILACA